MQTSPDRRSTAASSAALSVAATGSAGSVEGDEKNWTKDMEKKAVSKFQEVQLTNRTEAGVSQTGNVTECASVEKYENNGEVWTITAFSEDGIISKRFKNGIELDSWEIRYTSPDDAKKVWDYLSKLEDVEKLKIAGSKAFWEEFLAGKATAKNVAF